MTLLAIDPGKSTGWGLFDDNGALHSAGATDGDAPEVPRYTGRVVVELPEHRPGDVRSKPNDLITLARRAGYVAALAMAQEVEYVTPSEWKASTPKPIMTQRILSCCTGPERALLRGASHDTIDAVGIGLWKLGRMGRGGTAP